MPGTVTGSRCRPGRVGIAVLGVVVSAVLVAGCTSGHRATASTSPAPTGTGAAPSANAASAGGASPGTESGAGTVGGSGRPDAAASGAATSDGAADVTAPAGSSAPAQSVPTGDGRWHPTIRPASDTPVVPSLVQGLLTGLTVTTISPSSLSAMSNYPYTVTVDGTCTAARTVMAAHATAAGMSILAQGSATAPSMLGGTLKAQWLDIANGPTDGVDLSLAPGASAKSCAISGVGLTPVALTMTGPMSGKVTAFAPVTCASPIQGTVLMGIWALPLDGTGKSSLSLLATGTGPGGPGEYDAGSARPSASSDDSDDDGGAFYSSKPFYGYTQIAVAGMAAMAKNGDSDAGSGEDSDQDIESLPPGAHQLTGTVTMSPGMASGSLDLSGGGEHISGTFDCGTPATS